MLYTVKPDFGKDIFKQAIKQRYVLPNGTIESDAKQLVIETLFLKTMLDPPMSAGKYDISTTGWSVALLRIIRSPMPTKCKNRQECRKMKFSVFSKSENYDDELTQAFSPKPHKHLDD